MSFPFRLDGRRLEGRGLNRFTDDAVADAAFELVGIGGGRIAGRLVKVGVAPEIKPTRCKAVENDREKGDDEHHYDDDRQSVDPPDAGIAAVFRRPAELQGLSHGSPSLSALHDGERARR